MDLRRLGAGWYALQTKCKYEQIAATVLRNKGYEEFVPMYRAGLCPRRSNIGYSKERLRPLYPGYIFCRFNPEARGLIVTTPGVVKIVGCGSVPAVVSEAELENIRTMVRSDLTIHPCAYLTVGQRVRLVSGPLRGVEGILTRFKSELRVVVSIQVLQRSSGVEVDVDWIQPEPTALAPVMIRRSA